jgi:tetratricopeptide (TPR) repeat protein
MFRFDMYGNPRFHKLVKSTVFFWSPILYLLQFVAFNRAMNVINREFLNEDGFSNLLMILIPAFIAIFPTYYVGTRTIRGDMSTRQRLKECEEKLEELLNKKALAGILSKEENEELDEQFEEYEKILPTVSEADPWAIIEHARIFELAGRYSTSIQYLEDALELFSINGDNKGVAKALNNLGLLYFEIDSTKRAIDCHLKSKEIREQIGDLKGIAASLHNLGTIANHQGSTEEAIALTQESLDIERKIGNIEGIGISLLTLARMVMTKYADLGKGEKLFLESKELIEQTQNLDAMIVINSGLAAIESTRGNPTKSEIFLRRSLELARRLGSKSREADILDSFGDNAYVRGDLFEAESMYNQSIAIFKEIGIVNTSGIAGLGQIALQKGELDKAEQFYLEALVQDKESGWRRGEQFWLRNLGNVARKKGNQERAKQLWSESMAIAIEINDKAFQIGMMLNLGSDAALNDLFDEAEEYYRRCLEMSREIGDRKLEADSLNNLATSAERRGNYEEAEQYYRKSLRINVEGGRKRAVMHNLKNIRDILIELDRVDDLESIKEAINNIDLVLVTNELKSELFNDKATV